MRPTLHLLIAVMLGACSALSQPTATPIPSATSHPTDTATPTIPPSPTDTDTATPSPSLTPTATPSPTPAHTAEPSSTPTNTATPTITPLPVADFVFDNWDVADIPESIRDGISSQMIAFISSNNQQTISNIATAQPFTGIQTVYYGSPIGSQRRTPILEVNSTARLEVFVSRPGNALAFAKIGGDPRSSGLYILDLASGFSARVLPGDNPLTQRGHYMPPHWSPDGNQLAIAVATGYDIDIFLYGKDGSGRQNLTAHGSYELWPRWSPDGRHIAFVSDRADCPSWIPGDPDFCDALTEPAPTGGHVYIYEFASGETRRVSDVKVFEPPYWINARLLAFASGDPFDLFNPQRRIWQADISAGAIQQVRLSGIPDTASYLSEAWSPNGARVLVQIADSTNQIVMLNSDGALVNRDSDLDFPRFSMKADWAPDGGRIAIGGSAGQCPYGVRVRDNALQNVASGGTPPTMCNPQYSPDGQYIAFTGVNPRVDGRNDIYLASSNGFGATSLTGDLRGQVELLGWVGG